VEGLRKLVTVVEDVYADGGRPVEPPLRIVAVATGRPQARLAEFGSELAAAP
jgi:hypothetical protein